MQLSYWLCYIYFWARLNMNKYQNMGWRDYLGKILIEVARIMDGEVGPVARKLSSFPQLRGGFSVPGMRLRRMFTTLFTCWPRQGWGRRRSWRSGVRLQGEGGWVRKQPLPRSLAKWGDSWVWCLRGPRPDCCWTEWQYLGGVGGSSREEEMGGRGGEKDEQGAVGSRACRATQCMGDIFFNKFSRLWKWNHLSWRQFEVYSVPTPVFKINVSEM